MRESVFLKKNKLLKKGNLLSDIIENYDLYLFIIPAVLYFIIFHYGPMYGVLIAFKRT